MSDEIIEDRYSTAIRHFNAYPEEIEEAWKYPGDHEHGCLFVNADKEPYLCKKVGDHWIGDPISIRAKDRYVAELAWMTKEIKGDQQLPDSIQDCHLQHLPRLAYWQRRIDHAFGSRFYVRQMKEPSSAVEAEIDAEIDAEEEKES